MNRKLLAIDGLIIVSAITAIFLTAPAMAGERCSTAPASEWKPVHEITAHAEHLGYSVTGVEREGTCYEVKGFDRNGARVEILYNPQSGEPVRRR